MTREDLRNNRWLELAKRCFRPLCHGTPHQDILGIKGGTLAKQWFFDSSRKEVFQNAISDFKANAEEHIRFFREN